MKAKITQSFKGRPEGQFHVRTINVGETIEGNLAQVAIDNGWGKPVKEAEAATSDRKSVARDPGAKSPPAVERDSRAGRQRAKPKDK